MFAYRQPKSNHSGIRRLDSRYSKISRETSDLILLWRRQNGPELRRFNHAEASRQSVWFSERFIHGHRPPWNHLLEGEDVTALSATSSKDATTALRAAANQEAMRTSTLDLRRLISTFGSHDYESLIKNALKISTKKKSIRTSKNGRNSPILRLHFWWKQKTLTNDPWKTWY